MVVVDGGVLLLLGLLGRRRGIKMRHHDGKRILELMGIGKAAHGSISGGHGRLRKADIVAAATKNKLSQRCDWDETKDIDE